MAKSQVPPELLNSQAKPGKKAARKGGPAGQPAMTPEQRSEPPRRAYAAGALSAK